MAGKLLAHLRAQWIGVVALLLVLTGGTAYALDGSNTVFTDDIVNGDVKVADIGQGAVAADEIANAQVKAADIGDGEVMTAEIANGQVLSADIGAGEVRSSNVLNDNLTGNDISPNSLKGADVDESTLDIGDAARAYATLDPDTCGAGGICTPIQKKGVTSITRIDVGAYCVVAPGIDATETAAALTVEGNFTEGAGNTSVQNLELAGCGTGSKGFLVLTKRQPDIHVDSNGGTNNAIVAGPASDANDVAFSIVIP